MLAGSPADVFAACPTVILMLADAAAADAVLARGTPGFAPMPAGRTVVQCGTTLPGYSEALSRDIAAAGGCYIEAPVSGQSVPAARGELVMMTAGEPDRVEAVGPLLAPLIARRVHCGAVPMAMQMKLAVNIHLASVLVGLAEAMGFARCAGLDEQLFAEILAAGPLGSDFIRMKLPKILHRDYAVQGSVAQAVESLRMQIEAADEMGVSLPMAEAARAMMQRAVDMGLGDQDMVAVLEAFATGRSDG
jgi:3-hydroxyisobutyrate dehydrogenase